MYHCKTQDQYLERLEHSICVTLISQVRIVEVVVEKVNVIVAVSVDPDPMS